MYTALYLMSIHPLHYVHEYQLLVCHNENIAGQNG